MIPALLLILAAIAYRIATGVLIHSGTTWLSNFAPLAAIALCGAIYFPRKYKFTVPLAALLISDIVLNFYYHATWDALIVCRYVAFALVGCLGFAIRNRATLKTIIPASLAGSTLFYLITNVFSWLTDPGYAKTFAGLIQALTVGLPAYGATPTWMFFRNSLLSDLFFTLLFVACMSFSRSGNRVRSAATVPRAA
jgi:hypothetical protein